jgi:hypothetical protein
VGGGSFFVLFAGAVAGAGGMLMGPHDRAVHEVQQPVQVPVGVALGVQGGQEPATAG